MNVNDLFPSKYLKAHDLGGKSFTLTIRAATLEDVGHGAEKERKLAIAFEKATKMMLLNRTNAMIIASIYGPETDGWMGKAVTVYSARVKAFGAWHDALRIKEQIPARNVGAAQMTDAMQEEPPLDDENDLLDVEEGESPRVDPETGEILEAAANLPTVTDIIFERDEHQPPAESPPHKRLWGIGKAVFGNDWEMARPWVIRQWTEINSMGENVVESARDLSEDQKSMLGDYMNENTAKLQKIWPAQKKVMERRVANAKVAA